jgi:hypothetical protein
LDQNDQHAHEEYNNYIPIDEDENPVEYSIDPKHLEEYDSSDEDE